MALCIPDHKYEKAKKLIAKLDKSEENILIKYYIKKKEEHIDDLREQLKEYRDFFNKMDKFLPNRGPTIYR